MWGENEEFNNFSAIEILNYLAFDGCLFSCDWKQISQHLAQKNVLVGILFLCCLKYDVKKIAKIAEKGR